MRGSGGGTPAARPPGFFGLFTSYCSSIFLLYENTSQTRLKRDVQSRCGPHTYSHRLQMACAVIPQVMQPLETSSERGAAWEGLRMAEQSPVVELTPSSCQPPAALAGLRSSLGRHCKWTMFQLQ